MKIPGIQALSIQSSLRRDRYTTNGAQQALLLGQPIVRATNRFNATNGLFAASIDLPAGITLRASNGTGFLPPTVIQLSNSIAGLSGTRNVTDPRRGSSQYPVALDQIILSGGSPNLKPEKSTSFSAGVIWRSPSIPDLRVSLDFVSVKVRDAIINPSTVGGIVLNESIFPERVRRGPQLTGDPAEWAGPIIGYDQSLVNASTQKVESYDASISYALRAEKLGAIEATVVGTWQPHNIIQLIPTRVPLETMGFTNGLKLKANGSLVWSRGSWSAGWTTYFYGDYLAYSAGSSAATMALIVLNQGNNGMVPAQVYHDVFFSYCHQGRGTHLVRVAMLLAETDWSVGAKNIFNKTADSWGGDGSTSYSDPRLRSYYVSVKKRF